MKNNLFLSFTALLIASSSFASDFYFGGGLDFHSNLSVIHEQSLQYPGTNILYNANNLEHLSVNKFSFNGFIGYKVDPYLHAQINGSWAPPKKHTPTILYEIPREQTHKRWDVSFYLKGNYPFTPLHSVSGITGVGYFFGSKESFNTAAIPDKTQSIVSYQGLSIPLGIEYAFSMSPQQAILITALYNITLAITGDIAPSSNGEIIGNNSKILYEGKQNFTKISVQYQHSF